MIIDDNTDLNRIKATEFGGYVPRDFDKEPEGFYGWAAPFNMPLIPESEWADRIRQMERDKSRLSDMLADIGVKPLHQGSSNYCAPYAAVDAVIVIESVQKRKPSKLSAASIAAPLNGYRNTGNYVSRSIEYIVANGIATTDTWTVNNFSKNQDNATSREDRKNHNITEWWDGSRDPLTAFRQMMTALFNRLPVPLGATWMRHAVDAVDPIMDSRGKTFGYRCRNSGLYRDRTGHTEFLGSRAIPNEIVVPRVAIAS